MLLLYMIYDCIKFLNVAGVGQGWKRGSNVQQEGYGTSAVLPEQGIYLAASIYRPVIQVLYAFYNHLDFNNTCCREIAFKLYLGT